jgi:predicted dehydrogenase
VRLGVIGLGLIGQIAHLPNLARLSGRFTITHVSDLSESLMETVAQGLPGTPRRSATAIELFSDPEVDAVLLLTPGAHAPLAEAALAAGKHVLSEKPFCISQAEARRVARLADANRRVLQVAYMKAFDPAMSLARAALEEIGQIKAVSIEVRHPTHESQIARLDYVSAHDIDASITAAAESEARNESVAAIGQVPAGLDRLYREVLLGSVVHELSALRALGFAPPTRWEHAMAWPFDPTDGSAEPPSIAATARLDDGAVLHLQWLWVPDYPRYEETISIVGTAGSIHMDMPQPYGPNVPARIHLRGPGGRLVELDDGRQNRDSGFLQELRAFHAAITGGVVVPSGAEEALADTASLQALTAAIAARDDIGLGGEAASARAA